MPLFQSTARDSIRSVRKEELSNPRAVILHQSLSRPVDALGGRVRWFRFTIFPVPLLCHHAPWYEPGKVRDATVATKNRSPLQTGSDSPGEILRFEVLTHAFMTTLAAEAGVLHPSKWCLRGGGKTVVDADHAVIKCIRKSPGT